jgi:protein-disulfide isomerase
MALAAIRTELAALKQAPANPARARRGPDPNRVYSVRIGSSPAKGTEGAKVTIVEFSDFQCPFCRKVGPTLSRLLDDYPENVRIVYKHLPLANHQAARPAARAAVAAGRQGKFWEMHDLLFANQQRLDEVTFKEHARQLGLDVVRFESDYASPEVAAEVERDARLAGTLGVTSTPSFFVNGRYIAGAKPYETFKAQVDTELDRES